MARTLFTNVAVLDGTGAEPLAAEVLVEGNRIKQIAKDGAEIAPEGADLVDGGGGTPGGFAELVRAIADDGESRPFHVL